MFLCQNHWKFSTFSMFWLWSKFSEKRKPFPKNWNIAFLVERTKIETLRFSCKTALSKANVKTNRMGRAKWTYHNEGSFPSNCFIYLKICFSLRTFYKELIWCTKYPNVQGFFFFVCILKPLMSFGNKNVTHT